MFRSRLVPAAMAAIVSLAAAGTAFAWNGEHDGGKDIAAALAAKTSAAQAVAVAERTTGGRAVKVGLEKDNGAYRYEVKTVSKDAIVTSYVDPASGDVVRSETEGFIARLLGDEDRDDLAKLDAVPTSLSAAIAAAERHAGGRAVEAAYEPEDGAALYEVEVAKDNAAYKVVIDGATGQVGKAVAHEDDEHQSDEHEGADHDKD